MQRESLRSLRAALVMIVVAVSAVTAQSDAFGATQYALSVEVSGPSGLGTVSGPGINCPEDCFELYDEGSVVNLSALANPGARFNGWSNDCSGLGACQVTMTAHRTVTASFLYQQVAIPISGDLGDRTCDLPVAVKIGGSKKRRSKAAGLTLPTKARTTAKKRRATATITSVLGLFDCAVGPPIVKGWAERCVPLRGRRCQFKEAGRAYRCSVTFPKKDKKGKITGGMDVVFCGYASSWPGVFFEIPYRRVPFARGFKKKDAKNKG